MRAALSAWRRLPMGACVEIELIAEVADRPAETAAAEAEAVVAVAKASA